MKNLYVKYLSITSLYVIFFSIVVFEHDATKNVEKGL